MQAEAVDDLDDLEARLGALAEQGGSTFDAPGARMIASLLSRSNALPSGAARQLRARAELRLTELERRFREARDQGAFEAERLSRLGFADADKLAVGLQSGRLDPLRRASLRPGSEARGELKRSIERFAARVHAPRQRGTAALLHAATRSYHRRYEAAVVHTTVARELDSLPELAGRYHADSIAARALARLEELSPAYLRARLSHLSTLDAVQSFVELDPAPVSRPRRRK